MKQLLKLTLFPFILLLNLQINGQEKQPLELWYNTPAIDWMTEALPITMPSIVSKLRKRFALSVVRAMPTVSARGSLLAMNG